MLSSIDLVNGAAYYFIEIKSDLRNSESTWWLNNLNNTMKELC